MEDIAHTEPKKVVGYLVDALRPPVFKAAVKNQLSRQCHKATKSNLSTFLKWLRGELEGFMRFEVHIASQNQQKSFAKPAQTHSQGKRNFGRGQEPSKVQTADDRLQKKEGHNSKQKYTGRRSVSNVVTKPMGCFSAQIFQVRWRSTRLLLGKRL